MIDTHCHLEACDDPIDVLVERAREAGVERMLAIGMTDETCRGAIDAADAHERGVRLGRPPPARERGLERRRPRRACASWRPTRRCARSARPGSTTSATTRPRDDQRNAFVAQIELARELGKPLVIHTRFAADDTIALLDELGQRHPDDHPLLLAHRPRRRLHRARLLLLVRRQRHLPARRPTCSEAAKQIPDELLLVETDAPFLTRAALARQAERAGQGDRDRRVPGRAARRQLRAARGDGRRRTPSACSTGEEQRQAG